MRFEQALQIVDAHAAGEPGRVVVGGVLDVPGSTMYEKMVHLRDRADELRLRLLREPRGYPAMCANVILPPTTPEADAGFVIMEPVEYPAMSGTNTICVVTVLLETGMVPAREGRNELTLEAPAGLIRVRAEVRDGKVAAVTFQNVPAFAAYLGAPIEVPRLGTVVVDVAWGGMWYVITDAERFGLSLTPDEGRDIVRITELVKAAAREQLPVVHPEQPGFAGISIGQLSGPPHEAGSDRRNVVTVSTREAELTDPSSWTGVIDRSPCGTGTCAKMAILHARGELAIDRPFVHEGILGTTFTGRLVAETTVGPYRAVVPEITGTAWITAMSTMLVDPSDPYPDGYTVGDLW